jgi:hypothetical protein
MDWMTLTIELMGLAILLVWTVIPLQEFKSIFAQLRNKPTIDDSRQGFEIKPTDPSHSAGESH